MLLQTPAAVRFISAGPLLGPVNLSQLTTNTTAIGWIDALRCVVPRHLDWVIVGGESGPAARDCDVEWIRSMWRQCRDAGVSCFVKQLGRHPRVEEGVYLNLRDKKGGDIAEWDADLRVREFPETHARTYVRRSAEAR